MTQPPYPPNQPPYPPQPGPFNQPPGPPGGLLKFTVQGHAMTQNLVPPTLTIDGHPAPAPSMGGTADIPVPPGPHRLEIYSQWMRRYGQASLDINVAPNTAVEVFYAPPYHQFSKGAMGFTPQKRAGAGVLIVVLVVIVLILVIGILSAFLG